MPSCLIQAKGFFTKTMIWDMKESKEKAVSRIKQAAFHNHPSLCSFSFLSLFFEGVRRVTVRLCEIPSVVLRRGWECFISLGDAHPGGCWLGYLWEHLGKGSGVSAAALFLKGGTAPSLPSLWLPSPLAGSRSGRAP